MCLLLGRPGYLVVVGMAFGKNVMGACFANRIHGPHKSIKRQADVI